MGKVLVVDLTSGLCEVESIPDGIYEKILSGVGLGAWYLYRNIPPGADPLGPDNILGFTSGLLTGTGSFMTGRWMAVCKSPLTGGWGDSNCGGNLGPAIKQCGFDAIFVKGIAEKPAYLHVDNSGGEIRDAADYWGLDAVEAEEALIAHCTVKKRPAVAAIGPAGEKVSLIAGISNDMGRYAARSGVGAVMGSKRLKAVVLAGTRVPRAHDADAVKAISRAFAKKVRKVNAPGAFKGFLLPLMGKVMGSFKNVAPMDGLITTMMVKKWGSVFNNTFGIANGDVPFRNWAGTDKDDGPVVSKSLNPDRYAAREVRKYHCAECALGCGGVCSIGDLAGGRYQHTHRPEFETAISFSALLLNRDTDSIFFINEKLNRAGLDSISTGGAVAFAIECFLNGILTTDDTDGLKLAWGDAESILALVDMIIERRGLGDILADGVKRAAERIGRGSQKYAVHAGGQELPMHDPKIDPMLGVAYSADPTPGRHTTSGGVYFSTSFLWRDVSWVPTFRKHPKSEDYEPSQGAALNNMAETCFKLVIDGSGGCYYAMLMGAQHFRIFDYLNAATGWDKSPDDYMEMGKRIQTLRQMFNAKQGVDVRTFRMHDRAVGSPPLESGHNAGITLRIDEMIPLYYRAWGWDPDTGIPTRETFENLGLTDGLGLEYSNGR